MKTERERKLEAAMQFYARHKTWNTEPYEVAPAIIDAGRNAREALAGEDAGGGADHSRDFEGSDPRGMGPLPEEPGNPNPSFEQMENDTPPQQRDALEALDEIEREWMTVFDGHEEVTGTPEEAKPLFALVRRAIVNPAVPEALEEVEVVLRSVAGHSDQPMMAQAANDALNRCSGIRRALAQSGEPEKDRPHWLPPHWTRQGPGQYTRSDGLTIEPTDYYWRVTPRSGKDVHLRDKSIEEAIAWTDRHMPRARPEERRLT